MKKLALIITILTIVAVFGFAQEAITATGSNTSQASNGAAMNQYDFLLNPAYVGQLEAETLFFALDSSGWAQQFGADYFTGMRAGWTVSENLGFILDYQTNSSLASKEVGGEDTEATDDDYQNITLTYNTYDQATGRYATITEDVDDELKNNNIQHEIFAHSIFGIGDGMGLTVQALFQIDVFDIHNVAYSNTYSDTASPTAATLTNRGNMTETLNTLLDNDNNTAALDIEFGMNGDSFLTQAAVGVDFSNLRINNNYSQTVTVYNDAAGVNDTVRDTETITSNTGQYYYTGAVTGSFGMNSSTPLYLSTIGAGIGSDTEILLEDFTLVIPFDIGFDFPFGDLQTIASTTTVGYEDATTDNLENSRTVNTTTTNLDMGLDMYARTGAGVRKVFQPAENAAVTVTPGLYASLDIVNDTRTQSTTVRTQVDGDGNGSYADAASDTDTTYTESGYEIQNNTLTSNISLQLPVGVEWQANELMTFFAGYNMGLTCTLTSTSNLTTGTAAMIYQQFTDNLTAANSYAQRLIDGASTASTPNSSFSSVFGFSGTGSFGGSLEISENFTLDMLATATMVTINAFTVMGIMKY